MRLYIYIYYNPLKEQPILHTVSWHYQHRLWPMKTQQGHGRAPFVMSICAINDKCESIQAAKGILSQWNRPIKQDHRTDVRHRLHEHLPTHPLCTSGISFCKDHCAINKTATESTYCDCDIETQPSRAQPMGRAWHGQQKPYAYKFGFHKTDSQGITD